MVLHRVLALDVPALASLRRNGGCGEREDKESGCECGWKETEDADYA